MRPTLIPCLILPMLSACHIHSGWDHEDRHSIAGEVPLSGSVQRCRIDLPVADLKIVPGASGQLRWKGTCRLKYDDRSVAAAAPWQLEVRERDGVVELRSRDVDGLASHELGFQLTIEVPPEAPLEVRVGVGDVEIRGHQHPLRAETGVGDLRVAGCAGDTCLRSGVGDIKATGQAGALDAESGVGDVKAEIATAGLVRLHVGVGDVDVSLPEAPRVAEASADTRVERHGRAVRTTGVGGSFTGQLGEAGPRIEASAGTGDVTVRYR